MPRDFEDENGAPGAETVARLARRYAGLDTAPYTAKLAEGGAIGAKL